MKHAIFLGALAGLLFVSGSAMDVAAQQRQQQQERLQADEPIFGNQLMTEQERQEYRARMRAATTAQERERIRAEHHERMVQRAKERGITLPDNPPAQGRSGPGSRDGLRPGPGGMGPGGGPGGGR